MPFGKFKGEPINELPDWYLGWIWNNVKLRNPLHDEIEDELRFRGDLGSHQSTQRPAQTVTSIRIEPRDAPLVLQIFERGFRAAAKSSHPDTGGNHGSMVRLNQIAQSIREQFREIGA